MQINSKRLLQGLVAALVILNILQLYIYSLSLVHASKIIVNLHVCHLPMSNYQDKHLLSAKFVVSVNGTDIQGQSHFKLFNDKEFFYDTSMV